MPPMAIATLHLAISYLGLGFIFIRLRAPNRTGSIAEGAWTPQGIAQGGPLCGLITG